MKTGTSKSAVITYYFFFVISLLFSSAFVCCYWPLHAAKKIMNLKFGKRKSEKQLSPTVTPVTTIVPVTLR